MYQIFVEPFTYPFMARALAELLILGALAGTVGVLILLRRLAFMTDALTHTVFPGVVIGYLLSGEGGIFWGALIAAAATAVLLTLLTRHRAVTEDSALAVLLTTFFAVGVVLVSHQSGYTADLTAFLFGRILTVTPQQLTQTLVVTALVIALLIVPAAAARLLSARLILIIPIAAVLGAFAGWAGLAISYDASIHHGLRLASGGTVVLVLITCYLAALAAETTRRLHARRGALTRSTP